jgi:protoheme IX farnesyltransferase
MLPVTHGIPFTRLQILLYTVMLIVVSVLPFVFRMSGLFYLVGALLLGGGFLHYAILLMKGDDESVAMKTFGYSIWYLMAIFTLLLVDHYLPLLAWW